MDGAAELVKLIGNYGMGVVCLAVLIALHVYNVKVSIPQAAEKAAKQIDGLVASFREELAVNRTVFREELAEERRQCHDDHTAMGQVLESHRMQTTNQYVELVRLATENQKILIQVLERRPPSHR